MTRIRDRTEPNVIYFGLALTPLMIGIAWMTIHASAFAFLTCVISALVILPLALFAAPAVSWRTSDT